MGKIKAAKQDDSSSTLIKQKSSPGQVLVLSRTGTFFKGDTTLSHRWDLCDGRPHLI